jgi:DNA-nicking Smr family endonuclease
VQDKSTKSPQSGLTRANSEKPDTCLLSEQNHSRLTMSPACAPVSALVWEEVKGGVPELAEIDLGPTSENHGCQALEMRAQKDSFSPVCAPVSALVWGEVLALSAEDLLPDLPAATHQKAEIQADSLRAFESSLLDRADVTSEPESKVRIKNDDTNRSNPSENAALVSRSLLQALDSSNLGDIAPDSFSHDFSRSGDVQIVPDHEYLPLQGAARRKGYIACSQYEYDGEICNDRPHGWGFQQFKDSSGEWSGLTYRGNFVDGLAHCSRGIAVWSNGLEFKGKFVMGCPMSGSLTEPDGIEYAAVFSRNDDGPKLWEITERHLVEATRHQADAGHSGRDHRSQIDATTHLQDDSLIQVQPCGSDERELSGSEYGPQFAFLRNLFPDCQVLVLVDLLRDCEGDVEKAIEFLLPAEPARCVEENDRGKRLRSVLLSRNIEVHKPAGARKSPAKSDWARGELAAKLNVAAKQQHLMREFPNLNAPEIEEALLACSGDIDEARQHLLIMDMSKADSSSRAAHTRTRPESDSKRKVLPASTPPSERILETLKNRQGGESVYTEQRPIDKAEDEEWRLSKSKRARERHAKGRQLEAQYEGMRGDELRRLGFQHAKMHVDLSRMAVSAFQAGDRIEAARLSEKARHHQEQHQVLNDMARAKIIETFNPDMDERKCVDLHQLLAAEALELLETKLRQWAAGAGGRRLLVDVVTGAGNHSRDGRAVLRPRVKAWLEERGMRYYPINDGLLKVDLSTFPQG